MILYDICIPLYSDKRNNRGSVFLALDVVDEAACLGDILHEARQRMRVEDLARRQVFDRARRRVDAQLVARLDLLDIRADL